MCGAKIDCFEQESKIGSELIKKFFIDSINQTANDFSLNRDSQFACKHRLLFSLIGGAQYLYHLSK